jgi:hypothetical protein
MVNGNTSGLFFSPMGRPSRNPMSSSVVGFLRGISFGGLSTMYGNDTGGIKDFQVGMKKNTTEGSPATPSLELSIPGMFRFRWSLTVGSRSVSIRVKQADLVATQRPTLVIRANSDVGVNSDLTATAAAGSDWTTIGPITFSATAVGMVWVEVYNNLQVLNTSAYFDHIVVT